PEACEDIEIHHRTGLAFMTCGNQHERKTQWYPPSNVFKNYSYRPNDTPYVYDIKNDKLTPLKLNNFDDDLSLHGLGIYEDPAEPNELYLFLINHKRSGSVIELFKHTLNTYELNHVKTFKHELISSPNDIVPVSKDEFYVTIDFYTTGSYWKRMFEMFHSDITNTTEVAADGLYYANGITTNWDHSRVYVGLTGSGELLIFERKPNNKLKLLDVVKTEHYIDNVSTDPVTGEIYLAAGTNCLDALAYIKDETNTAKKPGFVVFKVSNNTAEDRFYGIKYSTKKILEDDGSLFFTLSVVAVDHNRKVMLMGSYSAPGFVRCELDENTLG
ncbi:7001_t:CDS:2, partial [Acaulospora colombiana]